MPHRIIQDINRGLVRILDIFFLTSTGPRKDVNQTPNLSPSSTPLTRPSFETVYMKLAWLMSSRSTCSRLQVGTVVTSTDYRKVLAVGYNGNASGLRNSCDSQTPGQCGCLHSEENAIINCDSPRATPKIIFVTHSPCAMCAKRIINLGNVRKVYYSTSYRKTDGLVLLAESRILVEKIDA